MIRHEQPTYLGLKVVKASYTAGGMRPSSWNRRRWLNQSTHSKVAGANPSRTRQGQRLRISSVGPPRGARWRAPAQRRGEVVRLCVFGLDFDDDRVLLERSAGEQDGLADAA